jgi:hypothetical protein
VDNDHSLLGVGTHSQKYYTVPFLSPQDFFLTRVVSRWHITASHGFDRVAVLAQKHIQ